MDGVDAVRAELGRRPAGRDAGLLVGRRRAAARGRRLRAGWSPPRPAHRVGLSAGARVVHVAAGPMSPRPTSDACWRRGRTSCCWSAAPTAATPRSLLHNAGGRWRRRRLGVPVVRGRQRRRPRRGDVGAVRGRASPVTATANVLPEIGRLDPLPARLAIREVFIRHVIGGKGLSSAGRLPGDGPRRHARRGAGRGRGARRRRRRRRRAPATCWSSTSAARPPTSTRSSRRRARTPCCARRSSR